jgi:hypothetical protein
MELADQSGPQRGETQDTYWVADREAAAARKNGPAGGSGVGRVEKYHGFCRLRGGLQVFQEC